MADHGTQSSPLSALDIPASDASGTFYISAGAQVRIRDSADELDGIYADYFDGMPTWMTYSGGVLSGTAQTGTFEISFTITDEGGNTDVNTATLVVTGATMTVYDGTRWRSGPVWVNTGNDVWKKGVAIWIHTGTGGWRRNK